MNHTATRLLNSQIAAFSCEIGKFLQKVQTTRTLDVAQFGRAETALASIADGLQHNDLVPKGFLNELRTAVRILRAENEHFGDRRQLGQLADRLDYIFDLILMGEIPGDRVPGKPRII
ncbi:hypothetical protein [Sinorhizobium medicae]|uniref:hypothetical protein n=1 Tax=Sinorhizobium medicae TaxID=110321 RepID=UPI000FDBA692|nr:hypothetical protein [Sinorhizobium medicae]RVP47330.1 hypothetical protein CN078_26795 [Sinorhizobium medicae]RVP75433.1 hypothetical protein CN079_20050 [Sinorhizobium medicae]UWU06593.1 hypothetical protein N2598_09365 [Sinorhizobium medicae]